MITITCSDVYVPSSMQSDTAQSLSNLSLFTLFIILPYILITIFLSSSLYVYLQNSDFVPSALNNPKNRCFFLLQCFHDSLPSYVNDPVSCRKTYSKTLSLTSGIHIYEFKSTSQSESGVSHTLRDPQ